MDACLRLVPFVVLIYRKKKRLLLKIMLAI